MFLRYQGRRITIEESNSYVGAPLEGLLGRLFGMENEEEAIKIFRKRYQEVCYDKTSLINGAGELIERLKNQGKILSVATNKTGSISRRILAHLGIESFFDHIYGVFDGLEGKPSPEMINKIVEKTSIEKSSTILVGDSPIDIMTAKNAGIHILSVASGNHAYEELTGYNPDYLLHSIADLNRSEISR